MYIECGGRETSQYVSNSFEYFPVHSKCSRVVRSHLVVVKPRVCRECLGHIIDQNGVSLDPSRIAAVVNFPETKYVKDARRVLGMAGWYSQEKNNHGVSVHCTLFV